MSDTAATQSFTFLSTHLDDLSVCHNMATSFILLPTSLCYEIEWKDTFVPAETFMMNGHPSTSTSKKEDRPLEILIIGAGVAGVTAAYALRQSQAYQEGKLVVRLVEKRSRKST